MVQDSIQGACDSNDCPFRLAVLANRVVSFATNWLFRNAAAVMLPACKTAHRANRLTDACPRAF